MIKSRQCLAAVLASMLLTGVGSKAAAQSNQESSDLRSLVQQWVETMGAIQKQDDDFIRDHEVLQNYRDGLKTEIESLKQQLTEAKIRAKDSTTEQQEKLDLKDKYEAVQKMLSSRVIGLENQMEDLLPLIPDPLKDSEKVKTAIAQFDKTMSSKNRIEIGGVPGRIQTVLILMSELEKFQNTITVRKKLRKVSNGKEFQMHFIYLGLAKAYAVNENADFALVGAPTEDGWEFVEKNELAPQIRLLVDATTGDGETQFVNVPAEIN